MSVAESTNSNSGKVMAHTKSLDELQTGYMRQRVGFCLIKNRPEVKCNLKIQKS